MYKTHANLNLPLFFTQTDAPSGYPGRPACIIFLLVIFRHQNFHCLSLSNQNPKLISFHLSRKQTQNPTQHTRPQKPHTPTHLPLAATTHLLLVCFARTQATRRGTLRWRRLAVAYFGCCVPSSDLLPVLLLSRQAPAHILPTNRPSGVVDYTEFSFF